MSEVRAKTYQFRDFELDTGEWVLRRGGEIVPVTPKALQALALLVSSSGRVVARKDLIEALWPDTFVEDSNLTVTISMLRKALGENDNGNRFVETVAKRGYRFLPQVISNGHPGVADRFSAMEIIRLTHDGHILDMAISPDARSIAYVLIEAGEYSLWIEDLESREKRQLLSPDPALCWGMCFTHDGKSLYYISTPPNRTISVLFRLPTSGGMPTQLSVNIDSPVALSPDGLQIAFVRSFPGQHLDVVVLANADGSSEKVISSRRHPDKFSFAAPSWSPDSKLIALGASRGSEAECAVLGVPCEGGEPVVLSEWRWRVTAALAWKDETIYVSAMALNSNSFQIWRLAPGGEAQRITNDPNNYEELSLAEESQTLLTMQTEVRANLWIMRSAAQGIVDRQIPSRRITSGRTEGFAGLAVGAGRIVYALTESQQPDLWSVNLDGSDRQRLTDSVAFLPSVARNDGTIAFVSPEGGTHHIWCMNNTGGNKRQLTHGGGESFPSISTDGKWVVYASLSVDRNTLWKVSLDGGAPVQITHSGLCIKPVVSPDGQKLACVYRTDEADEWKIALVSIVEGRVFQTFALPYPYNQVIRWSPDGSALNFVSKRDGASNIWQQSLEGSLAVQITNFTEDLIYYYDWSNDDLVVSRGTKLRDIVLIRNF
jgi:Tol biopolymer transport system component/DNA-binding winged helix-turn-helix (wHTH) protein